MTPIGPITPEERINSLDTLRGFALLGILPANVLVFGMYFAAGNDPTVAGGATGLNLASWGAVSHPDRGQDAVPLLDGLRSQHDPADLSGRGALRGHRRRHLLPAEPLAAPVRPGARIPAFLGRHPVSVRFVCADSVSVPEAPREEAPDHRRPVHRVQGRVVCRGRVPARDGT